MNKCTSTLVYNTSQKGVLQKGTVHSNTDHSVHTSTHKDARCCRLGQCIAHTYINTRPVQQKRRTQFAIPAFLVCGISYQGLAFCWTPCISSLHNFFACLQMKYRNSPANNWITQAQLPRRLQFVLFKSDRLAPPNPLESLIIIGAARRRSEVCFSRISTTQTTASHGK